MSEVFYGLITPSELKYLTQFAAGKIGVDLGTFCGKSFLAMMQSALRMVTVDNWAQNPNPPNKLTPQGVLSKFFEQASKVDFGDKSFEILKMPTVEAAKICEGREFDFVFIDADHEWPSITQDIHWRVKRVKIGGHLLGHDYNHSVQRAVDQLIGGVNRPTGSIWQVEITEKNRKEIFERSLVYA